MRNAGKIDRGAAIHATTPSTIATGEAPGTRTSFAESRHGAARSPAMTVSSLS